MTIILCFEENGIYKPHTSPISLVNSFQSLDDWKDIAASRGMIVVELPNVNVK